MAGRRKIAERGADEIPGTAAGEAVFAAPWQARAFAIAVTLSRAGRFAWDEFRAALIAEIAAVETHHDDARHSGDAVHAGDPGAAAGDAYYESWLAALERMIRAKGLLAPAEIERRAAAIAASPPARTRARSSGPITIA
ncbi:MAG TPA: nitrile hydratase accessory protein [Candidatus Binataceae bacterium]|nr:nitrile hydratase accessory protein [Candidatus Binataceae bacterium]HVC45042.1 nitrile hydratase accessory protein [Candidatus Binataceae bacterium]